MKSSPAKRMACIFLLGVMVEPAFAGDNSGVNCKAGGVMNNPDGIDDMNDLCQEWQDAVSSAQGGGMGGSADPQGGGTTTGPGTGPSSDVGPAGDPNPLAPRLGTPGRPRVDGLPSQPRLPAAAATASSSAAPAGGTAKSATGTISWEQFSRTCLAYHEQVLAMPAASAGKTCAQLASQYGLAPAGGLAGVTPLVPDITRRDIVARSGTARYSAGVVAGKTYVISLTGITGAAALNVYSDPAFKQPVACATTGTYRDSNANASSTYREPSDCTFVATGGAIYVSVTGTSYQAAAQNHYGIRLSPQSGGAPGPQGTQQNPIPMALNRPLVVATADAAADPAVGTANFYVVNATGRSGDLVISLTGKTGAEHEMMSIYDNPRFEGAIDNALCYTKEFGINPLSCVVPAGKTYYLKVRTGTRGLFTLMADALGPAAVTVAGAHPGRSTVSKTSVPGLNGTRNPVP